MKSTLLAMFLLSTNVAFGVTPQEAKIKSQLKASSVEIVSLKRDYTEVLTGILYMYQWFDGHHDYNASLRINDEYDFDCRVAKNLSSKEFHIRYCMPEGHDVKFDSFLKVKGSSVQF